MKSRGLDVDVYVQFNEVIDRTVFDQTVEQEPIPEVVQTQEPESIKKQQQKQSKVHIKVNVPVEEEQMQMDSDEEFEESEAVIPESSLESFDEEIKVHIKLPHHKSSKRSHATESSEEEFSFSVDSDSGSKRKR